MILRIKYKIVAFLLLRVHFLFLWTRSLFSINATEELLIGAIFSSLCDMVLRIFERKRAIGSYVRAVILQLIVHNLRFIVIL